MSDKTVLWGTVTQEALLQYSEDIGVKFMENCAKAKAAGAIPEDANWLEVYAILFLTVEDSISLRASRGGQTQQKIIKALRPFI